MRLRITKSTVVGALFFGLLTGGYVTGSWVFCAVRFGCGVGWQQLALVVLIGVVAGGVFGWLAGKLFGAIYRATRVD